MSPWTGRILMGLVGFILGMAALALVIRFGIAFNQAPPTEDPATGANAYTNTTEDEIVVTSPTMGQTILSPVEVTGRARGSWFFEASAPVSVVNWDGLIIGEGYVTAQGNWMTEEFVPFTGTITYSTPTYSPRGAIIFSADNPSDLPQYDRAVEVSVLFGEVSEVSN